eukprot:6193730-Pleurochrysis_carterae.AAC.2
MELFDERSGGWAYGASSLHHSARGVHVCVIASPMQCTNLERASRDSSNAPNTSRAVTRVGGRACVIAAAELMRALPDTSASSQVVQTRMTHTDEPRCSQLLFKQAKPSDPVRASSYGVGARVLALAGGGGPRGRGGDGELLC